MNAEVQPMRICVTNDDGIDGSGIAIMASRLVEVGHEVTIVCPDRDMSGVGTSTGGDLRSSGGVLVVETAVNGVRAFAVDGPPSLCTLLALRGLIGDRPDFVVSGINAGPNLGVSTLHSGTVAAAITATNFGVPSLAVSLVLGPGVREGHFETAASVACAVIDIARSRPDGIVRMANLNVPDVALNHLRGILATELDPSPGFRSRGIESQEAGHAHRVKFLYEMLDHEPSVASDVGAVRAGYASLGWLRGVDNAPRPEWHDFIGDLLA